MGFVKTLDEVEQFAAQLRESRTFREGVEIPFETTEEFVREVIPPCFEPSPRGPLGSVRCNKWWGNREPYDAASVNLYVTYGDFEGVYHLFLLISGDMPVTIGRELWGEVKKRGSNRFVFDGTRVVATANRNGVDLIEIRADLQDSMDDLSEYPQTFVDKSVHLKAILAPSGSELQYDPIVMTASRKQTSVVVRRGKGSLVLRSNGVDPLDTIPIVSTGDVTYSIGTGEIAGDRQQFPLTGDSAPWSREVFVPYVVGQAYDWEKYGVSAEPRAPFLSDSVRARVRELLRDASV